MEGEQEEKMHPFVSEAFQHLAGFTMREAGNLDLQVLLPDKQPVPVCILQDLIIAAVEGD